MRIGRAASTATPRWLGPVAALAVVALLSWNLTARYVHIRAERMADARAWTIDGPACATISEAELMSDIGAGLRSFTYGDVTFFRRAGDVECAPVYYDGGRGDGFYPVCQFNRPGDLRIRTTRGEWRFRPGAGRAATVSAPHGEARCVTATRLSPARDG